ncbi:MAG: transcription termination/antitermination protein NusA [Dehalococcoidia bacterium]|nr:transcription termination/antitermination protein NusA [Dehalococcoidia bacterium]
MKNDFLVAISQLAAEKNLSKEVVLEAVETALASAYKKDEVHADNVSVRIDPATGTMQVFAHKLVVEDVTNDREEMDLGEARKFKPDAALGETIEYEVTPANAGRIAAQTAKQVVLQRLREAEREVVFEEFAQREGDVLSGTIQRVESRQALVDLGKTEAVMPSSEQVRNEHYRPGQRMKFYIVEVFRANKGPQIVVSRGHKNLVKRLLEMEVPELFRGTIELKAIAREEGSRTKVAVYSRQPDVDAVGACVGMRGVRIQNIVNELGGERIDVIQWDPDPARFVANALSPAQVLAVRLHEAENTAYVVVPDRQLSLAIGKEGQNARLAAKLTGRRIDIKSQTAAEIEYGGIIPPVPEPVAVAAAPTTMEAQLLSARTGLAEAPEAVSTLPPEEEAALAFQDVVAEAEPVAAAPVAVAGAPEDGNKPQIRFAEDILGGAAARAARADRRGRRDDEPEIPARPIKKKSRRVVTEDEDEDVDAEYPGLRR